MHKNFNHMPTQQQSPNTALNSKLKEFFIDQLRDIYWAEQKLVKTLPKLSEAGRGIVKGKYSQWC
jgi:hypothetical protein